jgi:galactokinase
MENQTLEKFSTYFNAKPEFSIRAPGLVNQINEHTDYTDGFFPANGTIDRTVWRQNMALRSSEGSAFIFAGIDRFELDKTYS